MVDRGLHLDISGPATRTTFRNIALKNEVNRLDVTSVVPDICSRDSMHAAPPAPFAAHVPITAISIHTPLIGSTRAASHP